MGKQVPEPAIKLSAPDYEISDQTAAIKARRLMGNLMDYGTPENWLRTMQSFGIKPEMSSTRKWKAVLQLPRQRKDSIGYWLNKSGERMEKPHPKETSEVLLFQLITDRAGDGDSRLTLTTISLKRTNILSPQRRGSLDSKALAKMTVTFHVLQRMTQRGHALSSNGEISYLKLVEFFTQIWQSAADLCLDQPHSLPAKFEIEHEGAVFIVKATNIASAMALVTMLPVKR